MNNLRIILITLFLVISLRNFAQDFTEIKGEIRVVNDTISLNGKVSILSIKDSSILRSVKLHKSKFEFKNLDFQEVIVKTHLFDFPWQDSTFIVKLSPGNKFIDLGVLKITPKENGLKEVVISSRTSIYETKSNGDFVINVTNTILSSSTSVYDLLAKTPNIIIDENGVNVVGKGASIIYLNNKRIIENQLSSIQVNQIKKIEIITSPTSKFDANGKSVINIITNKSQSEGIQASITQNTTMAKHLLASSSININWRYKKWSALLNYGQDFGTNWESNILKREVSTIKGYSESENNYEDNSKIKYTSNYLIGFGYDIDSSSTFSFEYMGDVFFRNQNSIATTLFKNETNSLIDISTKTYGNVANKSNSLNLNYNKFTDTLGSFLFCGFQYLLFGENNETFTSESIYQKAITYNALRKNNSLSSISYFVAQLDREKQFNNNRIINYGAKLTQASNSGQIDFYSRSIEQSNFIYYPNLSNDFIYNEFIPAIYTQFNKKQNDRMQYTIGVRSEYSTINGFSNSLSQKVIDTTYINFFPNFSFNYRIDEKWNVNLAYTSSINRPTYQALDPFLFYVDSLTSQQGNYKLLPEYNYSPELNIIFKQYTLKIGYTLTKDAFRYALVEGVNGQSSSILKQLNIQKQHSYFATLNLPFRYKKFQSLNVFGYTLDQIVDQRPIFQNLGVIPRVYFYTNNSFAIKKVGRLELNIRYLGTRYDGVYYRRPAYNLAFGLSRTFFKNKLKCLFLADDILRTNIVDGYYAMPPSKVSYVRKNNTHLFRLTMTYNFGNLKDVKYNSKDVGEDNAKRIKK